MSCYKKECCSHQKSMFWKNLADYTPSVILGSAFLGFFLTVGEAALHAVDKDNYDADQRNVRSSIDSVDRRIDDKFSNMDRKIDSKFSDMKNEIDSKFSDMKNEIDRKLDSKFSELFRQLKELNGKK